MVLLSDSDEYKSKYWKSFENSKLINKYRIFSDSNHYVILGVHNKRLFEMEHSSSVFFNQPNNSLKKFKKHELEVY